MENWSIVGYDIPTEGFYMAMYRNADTDTLVIAMVDFTEIHGWRVYNPDETIDRVNVVAWVNSNVTYNKTKDLRNNIQRFIKG